MTIYEFAKRMKISDYTAIRLARQSKIPARRTREKVLVPQHYRYHVIWTMTEKDFQNYLSSLPQK